MKFEVFTLLPEVFPPYLESSILKRAAQRGLIDVRIHNIRDYTHDKHNTTDDTPYGGGGGMVMKPEPVFEAIETVLGLASPQTQGRPESSPDGNSNTPIILLTPQGRVFDQRIAEELSAHEQIALLCGRYEGVDERIREHLITDEISVGDYVLTGGELPALLVIDAVSRLIPGVLGDPTGAEDDSHSMGLLEYPHYTKPPEYRGWKVPEILRSGDHGRVEEWRREQALMRTLKKRPDMLENTELSEKDRKFLENLKSKIEGQDI
ncbi:MAG TPA: tRNA (guanosine(37)-N1)-methyltransferase TrmD [Anaerolineales bacterium]|nr:tRNA (guanosine(37)-N1)-methyltransferase TrmD [Anaerolineales bacterium]